VCGADAGARFALGGQSRAGRKEPNIHCQSHIQLLTPCSLGTVREDDTDAEPLDEDGMVLGNGEVVAMAVKELLPLHLLTPCWAPRPLPSQLPHLAPRSALR
jgi:hypothetical protein